MSSAAGLRLHAEGPLSKLSEQDRVHLLERAPADEPEVVAQVASLIAQVRKDGDEALKTMAERFDGVALEALEVPQARWATAANGLDSALRGALGRAEANIRRFHEAQHPEDIVVDVEPGVRITRKWAALERVGVYAPGGRAAYASSVLMGVVPAAAAGVDEIIVCSPPGPTGEPPAEVLAACALGGAHRLFALGGAGAVAAMAFGTPSVPVVDAVVGPGNRWVTEAKRQVAGRVLIDSPAGPSEVLVLADADADPDWVAHELLAQAEHDPDAACVFVATSEQLIREVRTALSTLLTEAPRRDVAAAALEAAGALLVADSMDDAVAFAQAYAPEHLSVMTADAPAIASRITTAGTTFVGPWASVAFGDYLTGANHVLPTGGRSRSFSGLSTHHFLRSYTVQEITAAGADRMAADVALLAEAEGLPAHRAAAMARRTS
jgi:histidinol dehydrogenase